MLGMLEPVSNSSCNTADKHTYRAYYTKILGNLPSLQLGCNFKIKCHKL